MKVMRSFVLEVEGTDEALRRLLRAFGEEIERIRRERERELLSIDFGRIPPSVYTATHCIMPFKGTLTVKEDI